MKSAAAVSLACILITASGFHVAPPSNFGRRAASLNKRQELRRGLSKENSSNMPPIIKSIFRKQQSEDETAVSSSVSVVDQSSATGQTAKNTNSESDGVKQVVVVDSLTTNGSTEVKEEKEQTDTQKMMQQVKDAGFAGVISYALWEIGFWAVSVPVCVFGYRELTGHWPDFSNAEDMQKLGAEAFAFVNFARFAVPLRIGLALSTTPWIEENVVEVYFKGHNEDKKNTNVSSES